VTAVYPVAGISPSWEQQKQGTGCGTSNPSVRCVVEKSRGTLPIMGQKKLKLKKKKFRQKVKKNIFLQKH